MSKLKYIVPFGYILITIGYFSIATRVIMLESPPDFVPAIPGRTITDLIVLFVLVPILTCLPLIFITPLTILNFFFLKSYQKKKYEFYHIDFSNRPFSMRHMMYRAFLPVLLALSISLSLYNVGLTGNIFGPGHVSIIFVSLLLIPFTIIPLIPVWVFKDTGIVRIRKKPKTRIPPELTFFAKNQNQFLKGYAGITTVLLYLFTIINELSTDIAFILILIYPIFLIGVLMPLLLFYEIRVSRIGDKIIKKLKLTPLNLEIVEGNLL
ncbi:MAG: hypothetical protein ACTSRI_18865 [Promethearchaeota archaeon]